MIRIPHSFALLSAICGLSLLATACDRTHTPSAEPASATPKSPGADKKADGYTLTIKDWEGPKDEEGYVVVTVLAKDGHKINENYPHKLSLDEPPKGLKLPMRTMKLADAEVDGEKRLVFSIPTVANADGEFKIAGTLKTSVCTADTCQIAKEKLAARVVAQ